MAESKNNPATGQPTGIEAVSEKLRAVTSSSRTKPSDMMDDSIRVKDTQSFIIVDAMETLSEEDTAKAKEQIKELEILIEEAKYSGEAYEKHEEELAKLKTSLDDNTKETAIVKEHVGNVDNTLQTEVNRQASDDDDKKFYKKSEIDQSEALADIRNATIDNLGISEAELSEAEGRKENLDQRKEEAEALKKSLEEMGGKAEDNATYNKKMLQIQHDELDLRESSAETKASKKQIEQERKSLAEKQTGFMAKISNGITLMKDKMLAPIKTAGKGLMALLKGTLFAGFMVGIVAFLNSEYWEKTKKWILDFLADQSWEKIKELFSPTSIGGIIAALGILTAVFNPIGTTMKVLKCLNQNRCFLR